MFEKAEYKILRKFYEEHGSIDIAMFQTAEMTNRIPIDLFNDMKLSKLVKEYPYHEADIYFAYTVAIMLKFSDKNTDDIVLENIREILRYERGDRDKPRRMNFNLNLN